MKFSDIINESLSNQNEDRQTKRINSIYKAFRTGEIKVHDKGEDKEPALYSYELSKDMSVIVTGMGSVFITPATVKVKSLNKECNNIPPEVTSGYIERALKKKFLDLFDIRIRLDNFYYTDDLEPYNEPEKLNESNEDDRKIKKGKIVYKALKKGTIGGDNPQEPHFKYELSDDFSVDVNNAGIIITLDKIKIKHLNRGCLLHSSDYMGNLIRKKFSLFGIVLTNSYKDRYFTYEVEPWESPINEAVRYTEEDITDKVRKRAKLIYKTFKVGIFPSDNDKDIKYRYTLPDEYYISIDDETGDIIIALTIHPEKQLKITALFDSGTPFEREMEVSTGYDHLYRGIKTKIREKFESFNIQIVF